MARYLIETDFGRMSEEEMQEAAVRSKLTGAERFPDVTWEHSHVCTEADGTIRSLCVYEAPSSERLREHAGAVGAHAVTRIYEIVGDITPADVRV